MNLFERYLTAWVALCIVAGIALGRALATGSHPSRSAPVTSTSIASVDRFARLTCLTA